MTTSGYRDSIGGWGFYYINMTRALMDIFNKKDQNSTLLAAYISKKSDQSIKLQYL